MFVDHFFCYYCSISRLSKQLATYIKKCNIKNNRLLKNYLNVYKYLTVNANLKMNFTDGFLNKFYHSSNREKIQWKINYLQIQLNSIIEYR